MYKVLIADDEKIIREGLISAIPWEALSMELCASAENGKEALEKAEALRPDLIITDIRMPFLSGLEFVEALLAGAPKCRIVIISGFEEFEYARTALRLGVSEYLLKPVDLEVLKKTLLRIKNELDQQNLRDRNLEKLHQEVLLQQDYHLRHSLARYLRGSGTFEQAAEYLPPEMAEAVYVQGVLVRIDNFDRITAPMSEESIFAMTQKFEHMLKEQLRIPYVLEIDRDLYFCVAAGIDPDQIQMRMKAFVLRARSIILEPSYSTVLSTLHEGGIRELKTAWKETRDYLEHTFLIGLGQDLEAGRETGTQRVSISNIDLEPFFRTVYSFDREEIQKELDLLEKELQALAHNSYLYSSMLMSHIYQELRSLLQRTGFSMNDIFSDPMKEYREMMSRQTLRGMIEEMGRILDRICSFMQENADDSRRTIRRAKMYIEANFADPSLSLDTVAGNAGITPTYLSALFKKSEKQSFVSYLTEVRLKHAKELLLTGQKKTYEVALECGYANPTYFSSIFKKHTGYSPSEYREARGV